MKHRKDRTVTFRLMPYMCSLRVTATDNMRKACKRTGLTEENINTNEMGIDATAGLTIWQDGSGLIEIILDTKGLNHGIIAHEVFHATHRAMQTSGDTFSEEHHEPYTHLCGFITDMVYAYLKKWEVPIGN